ncbi:hypothetical protein AOLI_G00024320 [Acnodon oligacanthus]
MIERGVQRGEKQQVTADNILPIILSTPQGPVSSHSESPSISSVWVGMSVSGEKAWAWIGIHSASVFSSVRLLASGEFRVCGGRAVADPYPNTAALDPDPGGIPGIPAPLCPLHPKALLRLPLISCSDTQN